MDNQQVHNQHPTTPSQPDTQQQSAVPYTAPPPPITQYSNKFKNPIVNGLLIAAVVLLGGFMTYNFVGHQLTHLAGDSIVVTPTPTLTLTPTPADQF